MPGTNSIRFKENINFQIQLDFVGRREARQ